MSRDIYVYIDNKKNSAPIFIGTLKQDILRGKEIFSFIGEQAWLKHSEYAMLDPDLGQYEGPQYLKDSKRNFGLFLDTSPDRWGRMLIKRREIIRARNEKRKPANLTEADFLIGVYDENRMGALRFKTNHDLAW